MKRLPNHSILPLGLTFVMPGAAHAHIGHIGEPAGHSHWIGFGALVGAAALAAALARGRKAKMDKEEDEVEEPTEAEAEKA